MRVHILEDIKEQRESFKKIIEREITEHEYDIQIGVVENDPERFLAELEKDFKQQDIFLIDIELKSELTGFNVGVKIRELEAERDKKSHLIYVTVYDEQMPLTFEYKLAALDFISKNNTAILQARIAECLRKIDRESKKTGIQKACLTFNILRKEIKIPIEDIIYISTSKVKNNLSIVLENGYKDLPSTIKEMESKLQEYNFLKVSESVLINRDKIKEIDLKKRKVTINTGLMLEISHRHAKKMKQD